MVQLVTGNETTINLDDIARQGAKRMLIQALEQEVQEFIEGNKGEVDENGHRLVVRHGKGKTRNVTMGSGAVDIVTSTPKASKCGYKSFKRCIDTGKRFLFS